MKSIKYDSQFLAADGQPFSIIDPSTSVLKAARDKAKDENKEKYEIPTIDCDFAQAMIWFVNNIPFSASSTEEDKTTPRKLTPEDTGNAYAVIKAFQNHPEGYVEVEDGVYRWLVDLNKIDGVIAFRITQAVVAERLEDLVKE